MLNLITNRNLKALLSKGKLTSELLMELKTSFFIHPSRQSGENSFQLVSSPHENGNVFHLFTSMEEYFDKSGDLQAQAWYLDTFEKDLADDALGIIINPASDNFFIPKSIVLHIIEDIHENNMLSQPLLYKRNEYYDNGALLEYLKGKKTLRMYANLFSYFDFSKLYTPVTVEENIDDDKISFESVESFYKQDGYYLLFADMNRLEKDTGCRYYAVADCLDIAKRVFEFDYNGIVLKTPEGDFTLPRKNLLRHYEAIIKSCRLRENSFAFAYKAGDGDV